VVRGEIWRSTTNNSGASRATTMISTWSLCVLGATNFYTGRAKTNISLGHAIPFVVSRSIIVGLLQMLFLH
jgi:hypothetical protein